MKLQDLLLEAAGPKVADFEELFKQEGAKKIDSVRIMIKNRKSENNLGLSPEFLSSNVDIYKVVFHNIDRFKNRTGRTDRPTYFLTKKGTKLNNVLALFDFSKPLIAVAYNAKAVLEDGFAELVYDVVKKETATAGELSSGDKYATFIIDKSVVEAGSSATPEKEGPGNPKTDGIFVIGTWGNPYGRGDESTWSGPYSTKKAASAAMKRILSRGPRGFIDWSGEKTSYFTGLENFLAGAKKAGINPRVDENDMYFRDLE